MTWLEAERRIITGDPVLVLAKGKTGSTTVTDALRRIGHRPVFKVHDITFDALRRRKAALRREGTRQLHTQWRSEAVRLDMLLRRRRRWDVVTVVREPIARAVSAFFYSGPSDELRALDNFELDLQVLRFVEELLEQPDWFTDQVRPAIGIDVYGHTYDPDRGLHTIEQGRTRFTMTRTEDLHRSGLEIVRMITGNRLDEMPRSNGQDADAYRSFVDGCRLPAHVVERAYDTREVRHFWTEAEIDRLRARWMA